MVECRQCREYIRGDARTLGSRCPRCRMPLYERPQLPRRAGPADAGKVCALHPAIQAIATCQRCGVPVCLTCRSRWHDQALCPGCLERALASNEADPEVAKVHRRQAVLSVVFALSGWALFIVGGLPLLSLQSAPPNPGLALLGGVVILVSFFPGLFAIGQAAVAIRARGERLRLATSGLVMAGTHLGIMIGFLFLNVWHN